METLKYMENTLHTFHSVKDIFIKLDIRGAFNIPKVHSMIHYIDSIKNKGTVDGYNTELPERLHINLTKELYRATNKKEYMQQMVKILYRLESLDAFILFLNWAIPQYKKGNKLASNMKVNL